MKLTGTIIKNKDTGNFLAFINEYSGVIAQGSTVEEAKEKLHKSFMNYVKMTEARQDNIEFSEPNLI
ncbi:hypothetical protein D2V93_15945 [Flagellimonas taeanensis]|uniref:type II toxin-antitoxin system HicB family antitoxin n=1 Tax=Flavobacteriaceae TaxID=49546 RepID=UPI000E6A3039|nr:MULTISPECIES: hypothetical protein [Allomuricauda]MDC6383884.1 hypothetical protein [Muricauda sp. SK9]RIV48502.1 hypothetical protein D2V93_15945 [Allomuricauda taeanensis]